ncbi:LPXTG cell wall anchor domain-containing protein [Cryptosporangium sp. NPDC051539]|uniref:LPXTG cell wall anchor domain-containing protein n=1 Tax=Cryptosporangium sp. NPDC051539 TaxID=3363962 RepID=UPI0037BB0BA6
MGAGVVVFVLAGGPTANADQCSAADTASGAKPLAAECAVSAGKAENAALVGRPGAPLAATPNEASPPAEESGANPVQPGSSTGPEVPSTPGEESGANPVQPQASTPPEVPETTPPEETGTQPVTPESPSPTPGEESGSQPAVPASTPPAGPTGGENQPQLPVTGRKDGAALGALGGATVLAGTGLVVAARRRRRTN